MVDVEAQQQAHTALRHLLPLLDPQAKKMGENVPIPKHVLTDVRALAELSTAFSVKRIADILESGFMEAGRQAIEGAPSPSLGYDRAASEIIGRCELLTKLVLTIEELLNRPLADIETARNTIAQAREDGLLIE